jgi:hypothetical protein
VTERIKECVTLWRTVAFTITGSYVALLIPWSSLLWSIPWSSLDPVKNKEERMLAGTGEGIMLTIFSLYVLFVLIYEAFAKSNDAANLLLKTPEEMTKLSS